MSAAGLWGPNLVFIAALLLQNACPFLLNLSSYVDDFIKTSLVVNLTRVGFDWVIEKILIPLVFYRIWLLNPYGTIEITAEMHRCHYLIKLSMIHDSLMWLNLGRIWLGDWKNPNSFGFLLDLIIKSLWNDWDHGWNASVPLFNQTVNDSWFTHVISFYMLPILKFPDFEFPRLWDSWIWSFPDFKFPRFWNSWILISRNMRFPDYEIPGFWGSQILRFPEFKIPGFCDSRILRFSPFEFPVFWVFRLLIFQDFEFPRIRVSQILSVPEFEFNWRNIDNQ